MEVGKNPFEGDKTTNLYTNTTIGQANDLQSLDNGEEMGSIFEADASYSDGSTLNYEILEDNEIELIKKELERYIGELKTDLENSKNTKGFLSSIGNGIAELFGKGDKGKETQIQNYENLLNSLDENPQNILEIYQEIKGVELSSQDLNNLKTCNSFASTLDNETQSAIIEELENQLNEIEADFESAKDSNGWISGAWNAIKNATGIGASSNKTQAEIDSMKKELEALKNGETDLVSAYKNITGKDFSQSELESLANGETTLSETSSAGQSVEKYKEGQKMVVDTVADMASGIIAVGAAALAPVTGGASLLIAGGVGAALKIGIKASDCIGNEKTYKATDAIYDLATGFVNGAMGPLTNGLGGAAGTGIAKAFGLKAVESTAKEGLEQAAKYVGKEIIEDAVQETVEQAAKQTGKGLITRILAKQGSEYILKEGSEATLKTTIGKFAAYGVDMMVDGSLSGAADGAIRAIAEGRPEDILSDTFGGLVGGAIASPIIGGGMRATTKLGGTVLNKINNKITVGSLLPDGTATKFSQGEVGDCAFLSVFDGILNNEEMSRQLQKSILTDANGDIVVTIGTKAVTVARESLTDEILSDKSGVRLFEAAYRELVGADALDGGYADVVAKNLGLNPVHIDSDAITDEVLEKISKEKSNSILSLGLKVNNDGVVDAKGTNQHYFSIKNVNSEAKTIDLVDTYDTSKTITMSFDDVKTQGVSIDGGTIKATDLPNSTRSANDVKFYGTETINSNDLTIPQKAYSEAEKVELVKNLNYEQDFIDGLMDEMDYIDNEGFSKLITILQNDNINRMIKSGDINIVEIYYNLVNLSDEQVIKILNAINNGTYNNLEYLRITLPQEQFATIESLLQNKKIASLFENNTIGKETLSYCVNNLDKQELAQLQKLLNSDNLLSLIQEGKINKEQLNNLLIYCSPQNQEKLAQILEESEIYNLLSTNKMELSTLVNYAGYSQESSDNIINTLKRKDIQKLINEDKINIQTLGSWAAVFSGEKFDTLLTVYTDETLRKLINDKVFSQYDFENYASKLSVESLKNVLSLIKEEKVINLIKDRTISKYDLSQLFESFPNKQIIELKDFLTNDNSIKFLKDGKINLYYLSEIAKKGSEQKINAFFEIHKNKNVLDLYDSDIISSFNFINWASKYSDSQYCCIADLITDEKIVSLLKNNDLSKYDIESLVEKANENNLDRIKTLLTSNGIINLQKNHTISIYDLEEYINNLSNKQFSDLIDLADSGKYSELEFFRIKLPKDKFAVLEDIVQNSKAKTLIKDRKISLESSAENLSTDELILLNRLLNNENVLELIEDNTIRMGNLNSYCKNYSGEQFEQLINIINAGKYSEQEILRIELSSDQFARYEEITSNKILIDFKEKGVIKDYDLKQWGTTFTKEQINSLNLLLSNEEIVGLINDETINRFNLEKLLTNYSQEHVYKINNLFKNPTLVDVLKSKKLSFYELEKYISEDAPELMQNLLQILDNKTIVNLVKNNNLSSWDLNKLINQNPKELKNILTILDNNYFADIFGNKKLDLMTYYNSISGLSETEIARVNKLLKISSMPELIKNNKIASSEDYAYKQLLIWSKNKSDDEFDNLYDILNHSGVLEALNRNKKWDVFSKNERTFQGIQAITELKDLKLKNKVLEIVDNNPNTLGLINNILSETQDIEILSKVSEKLNKGLSETNIEDLILLYKYLPIDFSSMSGQKKIVLNSSVNAIKGTFEIEGLFDADEIAEINSFSEALLELIKRTITPTQVTSKNIKNMMSGFFANNSVELDGLLSTTDFAQFGKQGLPLEYPRATFVDDLVSNLQKVSTEEQSQILKKLGISLVENESGNIIGYDGIINLSKLSTDGVEGKIASLANKFIKENSINTGNSELDKALNSLIEGMPEFINIIGKEQHATQELSVDAHILTVMQNAMANENYQNLSDLDKTCLKFSTILHDIAKSEGVVDKIHPEVSALYTRNIMEKYTFPKEINDRIFELVKNHHWLEKYNKGEVTSDYIASLFRHKDDYSIAKIMAESDLKGVSENFYNNHSSALSTESQLPIANSLEKINSTGQLVFTSKIVKDNLIPKVEYKGNTYKIVDFINMDKTTDLTEYGFAPDVTYDSLRLYVHMAKRPENLETVDCLSDVANGSFLCASYISMDNSNTYNDKKFGVSLEAENVNIANATYKNQASGGHKGFDIFSEIISGKDERLSEYRTTIPKVIKNELKLNDGEYAQLYQLLASKKYLSQIKDNDSFVIGRKILTGYKIKEAIQTAGGNLFNSTSHNESNLYNPKINAFVAKVNSIEQIPDNFLKFVQEHNLPIYLLGEQQT